ncbi:MAG TPA: S1/P1 nuclease [Bryobacteraceae bacterium]|nr:S1/P1 nuclease [Bryobacteraceae bacterium]
MRRAAVLVSVLSARLLFGWGVEGHRLVVRIADGMLAPATRMEIGRVLAPGESLAALASWADDVRISRKETEPWHYIDIPIGSSGLDWKRDCPAGGCILSKIAEFRREWRDPGVSPQQRREALLFLVHFVGDLHQPLHCANNHDKGGNEVAVVFHGARTNLHAVWDYGLLDHMPAEDQLLSAIRASITPERAIKWSQGSVEEWAGESWRVAQNYVYGSLPLASGGRPIRLGETYQSVAEPIVRDQIAKAGVRLAAILNEGSH